MRRVRRTEQGLTVLEMTIGLGVLLLVTAAGLGILVATQRTVSYAGQETESIDAARITLERLVNEIRDAVELVAPSPACPANTCLVITRPLPAGGTIGVRYQYNAALSKMYRATGDPLTGNWDPDVAVAWNIVNGTQAVFCRQAPCTTPSEEAVRIELIINTEPGKPAQKVLLSSYVSPRNL